MAVVARPYQPELAAQRGVIATVECDGRRLVADLTEKPDPSAARALERRHGARNLLVLEGRARVNFLRPAGLAAIRSRSGEPGFLPLPRHRGFSSFPTLDHA